MPQVLTTNASIRCPHGGIGTSLPAHPLWTVDGAPVLVEGDRGVVAGCPFLAYPCIEYTLHSMGLNATMVDGLPVILVTDINLTNSGLPLTMLEFHTTLDDSTPAPLPPLEAGQDAPPLPAALDDFAVPLVSVTPPGHSVARASPPPELVASFRLTAAHPLHWTLMLIDEPEREHREVSAGEPPDLLLDPPGGAWRTAELEVRLTMKAGFLGGLMPGLHHFYMTAVSRRGLSACREHTLLVT